MAVPKNANENYCTFTLGADTTAGGLPSQEEISKQLESSNPEVREYLVRVTMHDTIIMQAMTAVQRCYESQSELLYSDSEMRLLYGSGHGNRCMRKEKERDDSVWVVIHFCCCCC
jgi:hypothetical protein